MKKNILLTVIVLILIVSSCKKSYQCDCSQSDSVTYKERNREDAIVACKAKAKVSTGEECRIIN